MCTESDDPRLTSPGGPSPMQTKGFKLGFPSRKTVSGSLPEQRTHICKETSSTGPDPQCVDGADHVQTRDGLRFKEGE